MTFKSQNLYLFTERFSRLTRCPHDCAFRFRFSSYVLVGIGAAGAVGVKSGGLPYIFKFFQYAVEGHFSSGSPGFYGGIGVCLPLVAEPSEGKWIFRYGNLVLK